MTETPRISIVIPVYNEEAILHAAVVDLRERLAPLGWSYEIILAENGSQGPHGRASPRSSRSKYPRGAAYVLSIGEPNYGKALKQGILESRAATSCICDEIDLCDTDFHRRAVELLETGEADMVIGSKLIAGAEDDRPWARHAASLVYTNLLRADSSASAARTPTGSRRSARSALIDIAARRAWSTRTCSRASS